MTQEKEKRCGNCGHAMEFVKAEQVQLGKTSFLWGDWPNLLAGALSVEIWSCPSCRKLDFYWSGGEDGADWEGGDRIAQTTCPVCGCVHDLDDAKCPRCKTRNPNLQ